MPKIDSKAIAGKMVFDPDAVTYVFRSTSIYVNHRAEHIGDLARQIMDRTQTGSKWVERDGGVIPLIRFLAEEADRLKSDIMEMDML
jgi:hypothetical protein